MNFDRTQGWLLAALMVSPAACTDIAVDSAVDARKGGSGIDLDVGVDGTPGILLADVALRPGVTVDLFVNVYGHLGSAGHAKKCQFAVHGGVFAAASWRPYAEALGEDACVLVVDLPLRGNSGSPKGAQFGDLDLFDYVTAIEEVLERLDDRKIRPRTILGHSMGGTLVQMLQQRLFAEGSSLRKRFGIREAILVASDLPAEVPWALGDSGDLSGLIEAFAVDEPGLGLLFEIPVSLWPAFYFTDRDNNVVPGALTPEEIEAGGFNALGEPLRAIHQLNGTGPFTSRPSAQADLFEKGTRLRAIAYEEDIYVQLAESETLYRHLTGDATSSCFVPVLGPGAVHVLQFSDPQALVDAIASSEDCDY
ncbi:alpha/beta fold hydrolase [Nannocystis punicea]|uniref:Alpha/beta hydrolase n=1 Tax=Nannocystis punicea TaxID=2995304 RepID=A0ABY7GVY1_9BACT|nr:alpha/beta hydrolase [Nannocystis poenicansa]WAS91117.1 alpha/beta hydrolase [Nannocystis poenicansa]